MGSGFLVCATTTCTAVANTRTRVVNGRSDRGSERAVLLTNEPPVLAAGQAAGWDLLLPAGTGSGRLEAPLCRSLNMARAAGSGRPSGSGRGRTSRRQAHRPII